MLLTQHPDHHWKKGAAFHYNFLRLGVVNICFPLFGCPFVTGSLPHSPQFVNALARKEVIREGGQDKTRIVEVYENRVAPLLVNLLVLISLPFIGKLRYIPTAVICDALFLYMGLSGLPGNQLFERIKLVFTEEELYPPLHFTKTEVPRKQMHVFTLFQLLTVCVLFGVTRSPIAVAFPVFLVLSIPLRMSLHKITGNFLTDEMVAILDHRKPEPKDIEGAEEAEEPEPDMIGAATGPEKVVISLDDPDAKAQAAREEPAQPLKLPQGSVAAKKTSAKGGSSPKGVSTPNSMSKRISSSFCPCMVTPP